MCCTKASKSRKIEFVSAERLNLKAYKSPSRSRNKSSIQEKEKQPQVVVTQLRGCGTPLPQGTPLCSPLLPFLGTGHRNQNHQNRATGAAAAPGWKIEISSFFQTHRRLQSSRGRHRPRNRPQTPGEPAWQSSPSRLIPSGKLVTKAAAGLRCAELTAVCKPGQEGPGRAPQGREMRKIRADSVCSAGKQPARASRKCSSGLNTPKLQPREPPKDSSSSHNAGISLQKHNYGVFPSLASISATGEERSRGTPSISIPTPGLATGQPSPPQQRPLQSLLFWLIPSGISECKPCPAVFATQILQH